MNRENLTLSLTNDLNLKAVYTKMVPKYLSGKHELETKGIFFEYSARMLGKT